MTPAHFNLWLADPHRRPLVMGVLNVTPDSFSDGGQFLDLPAAVAQGRRMIDQGADLIDIGPESTRPGSQPVSPQEQIHRVIPVIKQLRRETDTAISIDSTSAAVAQAALDEGANLINDISAGRSDPGIFPLAARFASPIILMHMLGTPATMQADPTYENVGDEVIEFLRHRQDDAIAAGIDPGKILLDPGIGFGKTLRHNLELLRNLRSIREIGRPLVIGTSRKNFIGRILDLPEPGKRLLGTAATVAWSITNGADIVRVHDVEPMVQVTRMTQAIRVGCDLVHQEK